MPKQENKTHADEHDSYTHERLPSDQIVQRDEGQENLKSDELESGLDAPAHLERPRPPDLPVLCEICNPDRVHTLQVDNVSGRPPRLFTVAEAQ